MGWIRNKHNSYGWKYLGVSNRGKHVVVFCNDGTPVETRLFDTKKEAEKFIKAKNRG